MEKMRSCKVLSCKVWVKLERAMRIWKERNEVGKFELKFKSLN